VYAATRRLSYDQNPAIPPGGNHGPGGMGKVVCACGAGGDFGEQLFHGMLRMPDFILSTNPTFSFRSRIFCLKSMKRPLNLSIFQMPFTYKQRQDSIF
jgi:hypothetical protein